jgi:hypothetical protein
MVTGVRGLPAVLIVVAVGSDGAAATAGATDPEHREHDAENAADQWTRLDSGQRDSPIGGRPGGS